MPKPGAINDVWTVEKIDALKRMWAEGVSAAVIAAAIDQSRNSVISKAHKLKLASRKNTQIQTRSQQRAAGIAHAASMRASRSIHGRGLPQPRHVMAKAARPKAERVEPFDVEDSFDGVDVTYLVTRHDIKVGCQCYWPFGDPKDASFRYCGKPTEDRRPYCDEHAARAGAGYGRGARL